MGSEQFYIYGTSNEAAVRYLNQHSGLVKKIKFYDRNDTDSLLSELNYTTRFYIKKLEFSGCNNAINTVEKIGNNELSFPNLQVLQFTFKKRESERYLTVLPKMKLKKLGVSNDHLDADFGDFSAFFLEGLTTLMITHRIDPEHLVRFFQRTGYNENENVKIQQGLLKIRSTCEYLQIWTYGLTDPTVEIISQMKLLKGLCLTVANGISNRYLRMLRNLDNLEVLYIDNWDSDFSDDDWVEFFTSAPISRKLKIFALSVRSGLRSLTVEYIKKNCPELVEFLLFNYEFDSVVARAKLFCDTEREWMSI